MYKVKRQAKRLIIALVGTIVLVVGVIAIPYPGPGWLIVFAGLAILATEFEWANRVLAFARSKYDAWVEWLKHQHVAVRLLVLAVTGLVIITTLWLLNGFGLINSWLHLPFSWVSSPFFS